MAEDKIKTQENKLNDEQLEEVSGGSLRIQKSIYHEGVDECLTD